ncbi:MAG TPA: pyridoxal phosphate-dependent aminotransferase [Acidobacteriaceae bacterium]|jgi:histidinol-phosphate aminotransferase
MPEVRCSVSRRSFLRFAGTAAAAVPIFTEAHLAWAYTSGAQSASNSMKRASRFHGGMQAIPPDAVLINANENPLGPCKLACEACTDIAPRGGRYDFEQTIALAKTIMQVEGLGEDSLTIYAGSSEPLHFSVLAFTSPSRPYVTADPGYEAGMRAADMAGAKTVKVPLTSDTHAHDVKAMIAASPNAGVFYICNPNNPTGTTTTKDEIAWALKNKPKGSILLIDEAYIHFADVPSCMDMARAGEDVIVLRTFSKLYGMAGLRCGFAAGRPDLLAKLQTYGMNAMPITAAAAANVSLLHPEMIPERKKINTDTRQQTFAWLDTQGYSYTRSQSNCFMLDTRRDAKQVIAAMQARKVYIGRVWPAWPTHVRVTVGTAQEMQAFQTAFLEVMKTPPQSVELLPEPYQRPLSHLG